MLHHIAQAVPTLGFSHTDLNTDANSSYIVSRDLPVPQDTLRECPHAKWLWLGKSKSSRHNPHLLPSVLSQCVSGSLSLTHGTWIREQLQHRVGAHSDGGPGKPQEKAPVLLTAEWSANSRRSCTALPQAGMVAVVQPLSGSPVHLSQVKLAAASCMTQCNPNKCIQKAVIYHSSSEGSSAYAHVKELSGLEGGSRII